jgi:hypothetical protein
LDYGDFDVAAECFDVLLEHVDGHVPGSLDRGNARLRYADAFGELTLRHTGLLAKRGETGREAELVLDFSDTVLGPRRFEDLLLPLLEAHRRFPLLEVVGPLLTVRVELN